MSKLGRILLGVGILLMITAGVARIILTQMHPAIYAPLGLGLACLIGMFFVDWRLYYEFFTLKTTKHGVNMGWLIIMAIIGVFLVNFLSVRFEKKWDLTKEGLNSLSEQSVKVVEGIKSDVNIILLYSKQEQAEQTKKHVADTVQLFSEKNKNIKFAAYSALARPDLAQKYEFKSGDVGLFAEYGDRHLKIDNVSEEGITKTLLKLTRDQASRKTIYLTTGHGEREYEGTKPETISGFKEELEATYNVKPLKLIDTDIPADAAAVAIIGPEQPFLPAEIEKLKKYAKDGGHFLIAADPYPAEKGAHSNIGEITKMLGVDFHNDFILDTRVQLSQVGPIVALGSIHSKDSDISKSVGDQLFLLASSLGKTTPVPAGYKYEELSTTNQVSAATNKLDQQPKITTRGPHIIMMQVTGKLDGSDKEFSAVVAGDSDFVSNQLFYQYGNRDILLNSASYLAKDTDLISIHPKTPKSTKIELVGNYKIFLAVFLLAAPFFILLSSGVIWWRRRTA